MNIDFKESEIDKLKSEIRLLDQYMNQFRNELLLMSTTLQGISTFAKTFPIIIENIYSKNTKYKKMHNDIKDAFSSALGAYNEFTQDCRKISSSLDGWFVLLNNSKESIKKRDSLMKSYHHYEKKLKRLKDEREKAMQKNPRYIENKSKSDQIIRNERKFEASKSNYIVSAQATFTSAASVTNSIENYANPAIINLFRHYIKFFKQLAVGLTPLNDLEELLKSLKNKQNLSEQEFKEHKAIEDSEISEFIQPEIDNRDSNANRSSNSNEIYPEIKINANLDVLFSSERQNDKKKSIDNDNQTPQPKREKKHNKINATPKIDIMDEFGISKNSNKQNIPNDNYNTLFSFNNSGFDKPNDLNLIQKSKEENKIIIEDEYNLEDNKASEFILHSPKIDSKEDAIKKKLLQDLINKRNEEKKSPLKEKNSISISKEIPSPNKNSHTIHSEKKVKCEEKLNGIDLLENPIVDNSIFTVNNNTFRTSLEKNKSKNKNINNENYSVPHNLNSNSNLNLNINSKELFDNNLFEDQYPVLEEGKEIKKSEETLKENKSEMEKFQTRQLNLNPENPNDINAQLLLQTQMMMLQTMNQMSLMNQQKFQTSIDPNDPFSEINQNSQMKNMPQLNQNLNHMNNFQGFNDSNSNRPPNNAIQYLTGSSIISDEKKSPGPKSKNPFKKI